MTPPTKTPFCSRAYSALVVFCFILFAHGGAGAAGVRLELRPSAANDGWQRVFSEGRVNQVHTLQASTNLANWFDIAALHDGPFAFADPASAQSSRRFYRVQSRAKTTDDDGKSQITFPSDPFLSQLIGMDSPRWVKFAILFENTNRVWFQDSSKYLFHYDYASKRLATFKGLSSQQFDAATLWRTNQQAVLGAVLYAPTAAGAEIGIQFVGMNPYPLEQVAAWFKLVRTAVYADPPAQAYYMPTVEQLANAETNRDLLSARGVEVSRVDRWIQTDACYSAGWAFGRLVFVPADQINAAYADGRLRPADILITDGVPAEVPYVAGIVSLVPATPNSHVAILARSYGVPFVYLANPTEREQAQSLTGRDILLRLFAGSGYSDVKLIALPTNIDPALRSAMAALKAPGSINLTPKAHYGAISADTTGLNPADFRYFGGKASNYGLLRRTIPNDSLPAIAFSFDLWDTFLSQTLANSTNTLRQEIHNRLAGFQYPPDVTAVRAALAGVRDLIQDTAQFSPDQKVAVISALQVFDPSRKIRFRSSTNVEDSEQFTGAGLYDSFSGCLADDLATDKSGPSECDPADAKKHGVFRAIQRVYASFFNDNAWMERLRFNLKEDDVGIAVLVHHSFPDETEMANGVATVQFQKFGAFRSYDGDLASQLGAVSVANPTEGALPEVVHFYSSGMDVYLSTSQHSNLVPLGGNVMTWQSDYLNLTALLMKVADAYGQLFPQKDSFVLDLEYKKVQPGKLDIKQVREIPQPKADKQVTPFLLDEPAEYCVQQGESGDVFSIHRLKCLLRAHTRNLRLELTNLQMAPLHVDTRLELLDGTNAIQLTNGTASWPNASFKQDGDVAEEHWTLGTGDARREFSLETTLTRSVDATVNPVFTQLDFNKVLRVNYAVPMISMDPSGTATTVTEESAALVPGATVTPQSLLQQRQLRTPAGVMIEASFYWPEPPQGPTAGYTAPAIQWVESRITGLTSQPIVLHGYYSQTYHPFHHNFIEQFIFEPRLDSSVTAEQLQELEAANIQLLYTLSEQKNSPIYALGYDGRFRPLD
jgi:hypothetical protein